MVDPTDIQRDMGTALLTELDAVFNAAGTQTTITISWQDADGEWSAVGEATPVYLSQEQPSWLAQALQVAEVLRTRWSLSAAVEAPAGDGTIVDKVRVGNRVAWSEDLTFLVTGIDLTDLPGTFLATLEKVERDATN